MFGDPHLVPSVPIALGGSYFLICYCLVHGVCDLQLAGSVFLEISKKIEKTSVGVSFKSLHEIRLSLFILR